MQSIHSICGFIVLILRIVACMWPTRNLTVGPLFVRCYGGVWWFVSEFESSEHSIKIHNVMSYSRYHCISMQQSRTAKHRRHITINKTVLNKNVYYSM